MLHGFHRHHHICCAFGCRPGSPRLRVVESTFESEDIYRGSIGRRQSKDEPADFYPIATVKSVNRRSGSYGAAGGLSYGPDALRRSTASLSVEPTSDGSRRSYADPQSGVGSVLHGSKSEATATPSPPKSFNVVRSSSNPRGTNACCESISNECTAGGHCIVVSALQSIGFLDVLSHGSCYDVSFSTAMRLQDHFWKPQRCPSLRIMRPFPPQHARLLDRPL